MGDSLLGYFKLSPTPWALVFFNVTGPGIPLRSIPGFMRSPASQATFETTQ